MRKVAMLVGLALMACGAIKTSRGEQQSSVQGAVISSEGGKPIPNIQVILKAEKPGPGASAAIEYQSLTDQAGTYRFLDVTPGEYICTIRSNAFVLAKGAGGRSVSVRSGAGTVRVDLEAEAPASLNGQIADGNGDAVKARVELIPYWSPHGTSVMSGVDGRFSFETVVPGPYVLAAIPATESAEPAGRASGRGRTRQVPTYFPDVTGRSDATVIRIRAGQPLSAYNIRLQAPPVVRITGFVFGPGGEPAPKAHVVLSARDWREILKDETTSDKDGRFEFEAVPQGTWRLSATLKSPAGEVRAFGSVAAGQADVEGVRLQLAKPFAVEGVVERVDIADGKGKRGVIPVYLRPVEGPLEQTVSAFHRDDGHFRIAQVYPGRYKIEPAGVVPGSYVSHVFLGGRDVLGQELLLTDTPQPIRVVFVARGGVVKGTVRDRSTATILLIPDDDFLLSEGFIRITTCTQNGTFTLSDVRPGNYTVFAVDRYERDALEDVSFVKRLRLAGVRASVKSGDTAMLELALTPWPDL